MGSDVPATGGGHHQEGGEAAGRGDRSAPLPPSQGETEPSAEDEHDEQELGGHDGLYRAQLAEVEGTAWSRKPTAIMARPRNQMALEKGVADQAHAHHGVRRSVLDPDALEDGTQCIGHPGQ